MFLHQMRELAVTLLPELGAIRRSLETLGEDPEVLLAQFRRGEVDAIDVRPADEFAAGHLAGARSVPLAELPARLGELSKERALIAYCRGPWCAFAREAVDLLREHGFTAHRLELGVSDFRALGLTR
ncbi:MAG TPA: rhodanese-like domain-containing protein [Polyangiaceae bacterium]|nr:rhodanese-like domain-containing protein [Polyangiaceae bacterium]